MQVASPAHRAFSIYISDTAVIGRRDGILKLLFRIADVRRTQASRRGARAGAAGPPGRRRCHGRADSARSDPDSPGSFPQHMHLPLPACQVLEPRIRAYLYTWGELSRGPAVPGEVYILSFKRVLYICLTTGNLSTQMPCMAATVVWAPAAPATVHCIDLGPAQRPCAGEGRVTAEGEYIPVRLGCWPWFRCLCRCRRPCSASCSSAAAPPVAAAAAASAATQHLRCSCR